MQSDEAAIVTADPTRVGMLYTTGEVAKMLRVHPRTMQEWIRSGTLTAVRYGKLLRIREADLWRRLARSCRGGGARPARRRGAGVSPSPLDTPQSLHSAPLLLTPVG